MFKGCSKSGFLCAARLQVGVIYILKNLCLRMKGKPRKPKTCERGHWFSVRICNPRAVVGVVPFYADGLACNFIGETQFAVRSQFNKRIGFAYAAQIYAEYFFFGVELARCFVGHRKVQAAIFFIVRIRVGFVGFSKAFVALHDLALRVALLPACPSGMPNRQCG